MRQSSKTQTLPSQLPALRLLLGTLVVAVAGSLAQTAIAAPHGGMGGPGMAGHGHADGMMGGPGMGGRMGMMGQPHQMQRLLDGANATPEQRAQIKQITDAARADLKAQVHAA